MTAARRRESTLALAGLAGPLFFTTLVVVQGFLLPDYSHIKWPISALAAWPTGWIQVINFLVTGCLAILFAVGLNRGVLPTRRGVAGAMLLALGGVGILIAGIFSWKMVDGVPTETPPHVVGAITAFASTGLGFVVFSRRMRADGAWADLAGYTMATGAIVLCLFVAVGFFAVDDGTPLHPWAGLLQRVLCAVWFTCLIVLALRLRRISSERETV
jgi:hypothetical membrane protein